MSNSIHAWIISAISIWATSLAHCAENEEEDNNDFKQRIVLDFSSQNNGSQERSFRSGIERLFKNPAIASGIASGADALNRSVETLMDSVFYSLLDQEISLPEQSPLSLKVGYSRELYPTPRGDYIVSERFDMGPSYGTNLGQLGTIPVNLGINQRVSVYDLYLRNDGQRTAEQEDSGPLHTAFATWFGILPLLTRILPPSFNPNEMYDPLRLARTPLVFPFHEDVAKQMPIGSIRSYAISGAISVPFLIQDGLDRNYIADLQKSDISALNLPYTIVVEGEYRINVMRKSDTQMWVGLSKLRGFGHSFGARVGQILYIFDKLTPFWKGLAVPIFPLDFEVKQNQRWNFDQLFTFELSDEKATKAFRKATSGDFEMSAKIWENCKAKQKKSCPVEFVITKESQGPEVGWKVGPVLFIAKSQFSSLRSDKELKITEESGKKRALVSEAEHRDEFWDIFVGSEVIENSERSQINLAAEDEKSLQNIQTGFRFDPNANSPFELSFQMQINDRYTEAAEFRLYSEILRYFLSSPLREIPTISIRDSEKQKRRRLRQALLPPHDRAKFIHVTPTYLGRFSAQAFINFDFIDIQNILRKTEDDIWKAVEKAYDRSVGFADRSLQIHESKSMNFSEYFFDFSFLPFRLTGLRWAPPHAFREGKRLVESLRQIREHSQDIPTLRQGFSNLLELEFPLETAKILVNLSGSSTARSVSFSTNPKGDASENTKKLFASLNDRVIQVGTKSISKTSESDAEGMLTEFYPDRIREQRNQLNIRRVILTRENEGRGTPHVKVAICTESLPGTSEPLRIYARLDQAQSFDIGRWKLAEEVFYRKNLPSPPADECPYSFDIFEGSGPLDGRFTMRDRNNGGGSYELVLSLSKDSDVWSSERNIRFRFEGDQLLPP